MSYFAGVFLARDCISVKMETMEEFYFVDVALDFETEVAVKEEKEPFLADEEDCTVR